MKNLETFWTVITSDLGIVMGWLFMLIPNIFIFGFTVIVKPPNTSLNAKWLIPIIITTIVIYFWYTNILVLFLTFCMVATFRILNEDY